MLPSKLIRLQNADESQKPKPRQDVVHKKNKMKGRNLCNTHYNIYNQLYYTKT